MMVVFTNKTQQSEAREGVKRRKYRRKKNDAKNCVPNSIIDTLSHFLIVFSFRSLSLSHSHSLYYVIEHFCWAWCYFIVLLLFFLPCQLLHVLFCEAFFFVYSLSVSISEYF